MFLLLLGWQLSADSLYALEHLKFERGGKRFTVLGRIEVQAEDGGLLVLSPDGVLWSIQPEELIERRGDQTPFRHYDRHQVAESLLAELPAGFEIHETAHYVICHDTSKAYAQWCGALYERLYRGFYNYWTHRGITLTDPPGPLVALVFRTRTGYAQYARDELGRSSESIVGYYSLQTNRITMFDLTGLEALQPADTRSAARTRVNQILSQPNAQPTVATIVHEAVHQLAYNCGMHQRYADIPLWVSEGMAVYFETPDLNRSKGWRGIGIISEFRLAQLRRYVRNRPRDSLRSLVSDDRRFRAAGQAPDAYAEAWALVYFLLRHQPEAFRDYLKELARKSPLVYDTPEERFELFRQTFGPDVRRLDEQFVRYVAQLR